MTSNDSLNIHHPSMEKGMLIGKIEDENLYREDENLYRGD